MKTQQRFQFDHLHVDPSLSEPLFRQIEQQLREAIWHGLLKAGERLPSTRNLANELSIARNTVVKAYDQLEIEGFIKTKRGSGTRVTDQFPQPMTKPIASARLAKSDVLNKQTGDHFEPASRINQIKNLGFGPHIINETPAKPFRAHLTDVSEFPFEIWTQIFQKKIRREGTNLMGETHPLGYQPLREAIADYLGAAQGLLVNPEQVVITSGTQQSIELLARVLINPGDTVAFEEPGYTPALASCMLYGANTLSIPVDEQGIEVSKLHKLRRKIKFVYVTPASQFPLGMTLSQPRRQALLQWAYDNKALIIEDDYNGEYRYRGRPLPTLYSMADNQQCIYLGSFSKLLFPAFRLGYMVVPESMLDALTTARWLLDRHSPPLLQAVLSEFINKGHFARHMRRMRALYATRQTAAIAAAKKYVSDIMTVPSLDGGLHLVGWLADHVNEANLITVAEQAGIELVPNSAFSVDGMGKSSVLIGYASFTEGEIAEAFKRLGEAYRELFCTTS